MECEVKRGGEGAKGSDHLPVSVLEEEVKTAADQLLLTNFSACLDTCRHVITSVQACEDKDSESVSRLQQVQERATVLGIQALAEQGTWTEVIPFVEQVYSHMATCPATIMQMCILLHSHVREYLVCHSLVDVWLDWGDHRHLPESNAIVSTYVTNVLLPLRAYNLIPQIVERCTALSLEERQALLSPRPLTSAHPDLGMVSRLSDPSTAACKDGDTSVKPTPLQACEAIHDGDKPKGLKVVISTYLRLARRLWRAIAKKGWCLKLRRATKLFFLVSFVLLAILQVQTVAVPLNPTSGSAPEPYQWQCPRTLSVAVPLNPTSAPEPYQWQCPRTLPVAVPLIPMSGSAPEPYQWQCP
ncbi:hypothetical protein ACOMHN_021531 [Nucella lapillus]